MRHGSVDANFYKSAPYAAARAAGAPRSFIIEAFQLLLHGRAVEWGRARGVDRCTVNTVDSRRREKGISGFGIKGRVISAQTE